MRTLNFQFLTIKNKRPLFALIVFSIFVLSLFFGTSFNVLGKERSYSDKTFVVKAENASFDYGKNQSSVNAVHAYGIYLDRKFIATCENSDQIDFLLNSLLMKYSSSKGSTSYFDRDVCMVEGDYSADDLRSYFEIKDLLLSQSGETISFQIPINTDIDDLCDIFSLSRDEIASVNTSDLNSLKQGDCINIKIGNSILNVVTETTENYNVPVLYETKYTENSEMNTNTQNCLVEGKNGSDSYVDNVKYINGNEAQRVNVSYKRLSEPQNALIEVGTKVLGVATGEFMWPVPSTHSITSTFGPRWGTNHNGIDISSGNCYGQAIVASDGGVVTCASELNDGYGIHVIIDHGNGYQTLYGHASDVCVSVGDKVAQGQTIAYIGSTGNSTGPHLHFEIIQGGTKTDPLEFLS